MEWEVTELVLIDCQQSLLLQLLSVLTIYRKIFEPKLSTRSPRQGLWARKHGGKVRNLIYVGELALRTSTATTLDGTDG